MKVTKKSEQKKYRQILGLTMACGALASGTVLGQTNSTPAATNAPAATNVLDTVTVEGHLNEARGVILTEIGASAYSIDSVAIQNEAQGNNASFNQVLLRAPGVAADSLGQLHVRGEHGNLQYRINDVLLPEGISGFGSELDPRFVKNMQLITGSLPAEYGLRTAGIVDIQTKSGAALNGGSVEVYGGSYDTIRPSFEYGSTVGKSSFFINGSYDHNDLGIENPTGSSMPMHDSTDQYKSFMYFSHIMDPTSRIIVMGSVSYSQFEVPINPSLPATPQPGTTNTPWLGTAEPSVLSLNDNQNEQNYYGVVAYQKSSGDLNYQASIYARNSSAHYVPGDIPAALDYNAGIATDENRILYSGGAQLDLSYTLGDKHTLRGGLTYLHEAVTVDTTTTVFDVNAAGDATSGPIPIIQDTGPHADLGGFYLQDEWKILPQLTLNAGGRFDVYTSDTDAENQISPRANLVYKPWESTTLHGGYSRYFTPPPLETVPAGNIVAFNGTSGATAVTGPLNAVRAERANYYDLGISQKMPQVPGLTLGVDGYYKTAEEQLDDGFFGQSLIISAFNYKRGRVRGVEFTANYDKGGFSTYANVAYSVAQGNGAASAQEIWGDNAARDYVNGHWISLDHDQRVTGSFGAAYVWNEPGRWSTRVFVDALYGTGLRQNGPGFIPGTTEGIPNGSSVGAYYTVNLGVAERLRFTKKQSLVARLDIVNVTDDIYALRSGSGVGVNAAQYGERRGFFGSLSYLF
jgi:outer membrane receptor protein involved in Fe transport